MKQFEGKTLGYMARRSGFRLKGYRVYVLQDPEDQNGVRIGEEYELGRILQEHPELRRSRIVRIEDYFGLTILRVRGKQT